MKFAIITYILHKEHSKSYFSYEPYIREMNIWLSKVDEVIIVAPKILSIPKTIETPYLHPRIAFMKIPAISFLNFSEIIRSLIKFPRICYVIFRAMNKADHIHLRCPGNIGLIACFIQMLFPHKPKTVKYAGNWDPNSNQPWSYRLQKWILSNTFLSKNIKVLVYGNWPNQSNNLVSFFTASFSETEKVIDNKNFTSPFKFIFVGNLVKGKRPLFAIKLIEAMIAKGVSVSLELYGSGVLENMLQEYITSNNLDSFVKLMGVRKLKELKEVYKISHFLILPSQSEGWPKAIAEAMFFGCIPIATSVSCVPYMLGQGRQGILIEPEIDKAADSVISFLRNEKKLNDVSKRAMNWSTQFTLEKFEREIIRLI